MDRPYVVVYATSTLDGKISGGPNRNMWDDIDDQRLHGEGSDALSRTVERFVEETHRPAAGMLGSNSLIKEGDALAPLLPVDGEAGACYDDFLPDEVMCRRPKWMVVVDGRADFRADTPGKTIRGTTCCI